MNQGLGPPGGAAEASETPWADTGMRWVPPGSAWLGTNWVDGLVQCQEATKIAKKKREEKKNPKHCKGWCKLATRQHYHSFPSN